MIDKDGYEHVMTILKGTFRIAADGTPSPAPVQVPVLAADEPRGAPEASSTRYEHDFVLRKPMCDVVVNGSAWGPRGAPTKSTDVRLVFAGIDKTLRVYGDRVWKSTVNGSFRVGAPKPFERIPLHWEHSYGGQDFPPDNRHAWAYEQRNPVGRGTLGLHSIHKRAGSLLPNVEDPNELIEHPRQTPKPVGFGFVGRGWQPRLALAGTFGDNWVEERFPFFPSDFDERYYQGAPSDQWVVFPQGGECGWISNASSSGLFQFEIPSLAVPVVIESYAYPEDHYKARIDTVIIEPDARRIIVSWRCTVRRRGKLTDIQRIRVGEATPAYQRAAKYGKTYVERTPATIER